MKRWVPLLVLSFWMTGSASAHEVSCPAGGVDGQRVAVSAGTTDVAGKIPSPSAQQTAFWLCCNRDSGACTDKDVGGTASGYIVSLEDVNTCTVVDVTIGFRNDASGVNQTVGTLSLGTTSLVIPGPRNRRVTATVNTSTGCSASEVDVRLDLVNWRTEGIN